MFHFSLFSLLREMVSRALSYGEVMTPGGQNEHQEKAFTYLLCTEMEKHPVSCLSTLGMIMSTAQIERW